jgi:hypothetical protein
LEIRSKSVVLTNGTFLNGLIHIGKNNLEEEEQARVLRMELPNSCRFWIRSNENRNASKSGWTFVGLFKMNEEEKGDAKPDKFSYSDVTSFIRDRVTWRTRHLKFMIFWEKVLIVRQCLTENKKSWSKIVRLLKIKLIVCWQGKTPIICGARRMEYVWGLCKWIFNFAPGRYSI